MPRSMSTLFCSPYDHVGKYARATHACCEKAANFFFADSADVARLSASAETVVRPYRSVRIAISLALSFTNWVMWWDFGTNILGPIAKIMLSSSATT